MSLFLSERNKTAAILPLPRLSPWLFPKDFGIKSKDYRKTISSSAAGRYCRSQLHLHVDILKLRPVVPVTRILNPRARSVKRSPKWIASMRGGSWAYCACAGSPGGRRPKSRFSLSEPNPILPRSCWQEARACGKKRKALARRGLKLAGGWGGGAAVSLSLPSSSLFPPRRR